MVSSLMALRDVRASRPAGCCPRGRSEQDQGRRKGAGCADGFRSKVAESLTAEWSKCAESAATQRPGRQLWTDDLAAHVTIL